MRDLTFSIVSAHAERFAAAPTLIFRLRIDERGPDTSANGDEGKIQAVLLRCQIRIEPRRRRYTVDEEDRLFEIFGEARRFGETLRSMLWSHATLVVPPFDQSIEVDLPMPCTYDFEVAAAKYLMSLDSGEVPLLFLFSGTVFSRSGNGFSIEQVPWEKEALFKMPVSIWRGLMDSFFPNSTWIRLGRESFDALQRFKGRQALPTWDDVIQALIGSAAARRSA